MSYVYFIQAEPNGPIKVGTTRHDPRRRLVKIQSDCAMPVNLIGAVMGSASDERRLHAKLAEHRLHGEWFAPHPEVLSVVYSELAGGKQPLLDRNRRPKHDHPLCKYRSESGVTLQQLAAEIGSTHATLSRIESGRQRPSIETASKISRATGLPMKALLPDLCSLLSGEAA